jgi:hypothetical protein
MAVLAHGHQRGTDNLDVLLSPPGFADFSQLFTPNTYAPLPGHARRFTDTENRVPVDFFLTGHFPGRSGRGPVAFSDPSVVKNQKGSISYVNLNTLLSLKLAAGRYQDLADVVGLAAVNHLGHSYVRRLHESLRDRFLGCLDEIRRQEEFETRTD